MPDDGSTSDAAGVSGTLCPYCGFVSFNAHECERCRGVFEPLSRQASQNAMGPWFIRDEANPFRPGCSYATVRQLVARGRIGPDTILRGPSTRQFWMRARNVPGLANLLGECHACHHPASPSAASCGRCGAGFAVEEDRQYMGLAEVRLIPGTPAARAAASVRPSAPAAVEPVGELVPDEPAPYEPPRNPGRAPRQGSGPSDAEIAAMLRRPQRAPAPVRHTVWVIAALAVLAIAGIMIVVAYAVTVAGAGARKNAAATSGVSSR